MFKVNNTRISLRSPYYALGFSLFVQNSKVYLDDYTDSIIICFRSEPITKAVTEISWDMIPADILIHNVVCGKTGIEKPYFPVKLNSENFIHFASTLAVTTPEIICHMGISIDDRVNSNYEQYAKHLHLWDSSIKECEREAMLKFLGNSIPYYVSGEKGGETFQFFVIFYKGVDDLDVILNTVVCNFGFLAGIRSVEPVHWSALNRKDVVRGLFIPDNSLCFGTIPIQLGSRHFVNCALELMRME